MDSSNDFRVVFRRLPMFTALVLAVLACISPASAAGILRTVDLDTKAVNMAMASEANGDLHLAFRAGQGGISELCEIRYVHYTAATGTWHLPSVLLQSTVSPCERGDGGQVINGRVAENQPRIAVDPTTPGRAFVVFAGSPAERTRPTLIQVDTRPNPRGVVTRKVSLGNLIREVKGVDLAVGPDGVVHVAYIRLFDEPNRNRIEVHRGASSGGPFTLEIATGSRGTGEGISVSAAGDGRARVTGTFRRDLNFSRRENVTQAQWIPAPTLYEVTRGNGDGLRSAMGKLRFLPSGPSAPHQVAMIDALPDNVPHLGPFFYREVMVLELDGEAKDPQPSSVLHRYIFNNVSFEGGDPFSGEDINVAESPSGALALSYGIDGTLTELRNDLVMALVKPAQVDWPDGFQDLNADGLDDRMMSRSLNSLTGAVPGVFEGEGGRSAVVLPTGETPAVAFSGEKLWVAYYDQTVNLGRVVEVEVPGVPMVPEFGPVALLACLMAWSLVLVRRKQTQA